MFSLEGMLALVTGGAGSVGRAICLTLAEAGADLVIADTRRLGAENTAEKVRAFRRFTLVLPMDVTDREQVQAMVRLIPEELGDRTPDILVNSAARTDTWALAEDLEAAQRNRDAAINLAGTRNLTEAVLPTLKAKNWGRIINVSLPTVRVNSSERQPPAAAESALVEFTRSAALDAAPFHVTVNAVLPGLISDAAYYRLPDDVRERMTACVPMGCAGEPRDVAALVAFLASPEAGYITGVAIPVAGGLGLFNPS